MIGIGVVGHQANIEKKRIGNLRNPTINGDLDMYIHLPNINGEKRYSNLY